MRLGAPPSSLLLAAMLTIGMIASLARIAAAGSGQVIVTPPATVRNTSGLRLSVDTQWVDASGYRDVRLILATANGGPSPDDRELQLDFSPNAYAAADFITRGTIKLPQGEKQATAHLLVPQGQPWHQVRVNVYEGGSLWKELSSMTSISNTGDEWSEAVPSFLLIDAQAPTPADRFALLTRYNLNMTQFPVTKKLVDVRGVEMLVKRGMYYPQSDGERPGDAELLRRVSATSRLELLPPRALPDNWLGLTAFDFVVVSSSDLQAMAKQNAPQCAALVAWVRGGGNLVVYDLGETYERLPALERLLELSPPSRDLWQAAEQRDFNDNTTRSFQEMQNNYSYYTEESVEYGPDGQPIAPTTTTATATPFETAFGSSSGPKLLTRQAGLGCVVAMATANPYPGSSTEWSWVLNTVESGRYMWYLRNGLSLRRENTDYWNLLVPNTGMAPVWEFCILITLFAVVIGPVNYFLLLKQKRLYLLLATIPLGAALVTLGLFLYAVVSDGLGTRVRIRSYTAIDQSAGRAASWSRQSYYAGLAPLCGLSFPADAAVYVSEQHPRTDYSSGFQRQRVVTWDETQNFRAGYMSSRVTSQFLVQSSVESTAALRVDLGDPTQAQNGLGADIEQILLRDAAGEYFWAEDVAAGAQFKFQPAKFDACRDKLKRQFADHVPSEPPGLDASQFNGWYGGVWYGGWGIDNSQPPPRMASSLMEQQLRRLHNASKDTLSPSSYVAIVSSSPEVPLGVSGAREEGSFHVIEGKF